jgi:hypothetical protein
MATLGMQLSSTTNPGDSLSTPNVLVSSIADIGMSSGRPSVSQGGSGASRFGQFSRSAFFARHNPHPVRVRHMRGLLDCPICHVNDDGYEFDKYVWRDMHTHRDLPGTSFPPNYHMENTIAKNHLPPSSHEHPHHHHSSTHLHQPHNSDPTTPYHMTSRMPVTAINLGNAHQKLNTDTIRGLQNWTGLQNYSFKEKADPMLGIVPVTENWRQELRALTEAAMLAVEEKRRQEAEHETHETGGLKHPATWLKGGPTTSESGGWQQYSMKTGRLITPSLPRLSTHQRSLTVFGEWNGNAKRPNTTNRDIIETRAAPLSRSGASRGGSRGADNGYYDPHGGIVHANSTPQGGYDHIFHAQDPELEVFSMLCGILQTDDTHAVQAWLASASEREKALVLDIVRATMLNRDEYFKQDGRYPMTSVKENEERNFHASHGENSAANNEKNRLVNQAAEVNRLIIHSDNELNKSSPTSFQEDDKNQSMAELFRPISPPKSPGKGSKKANKRASSVKGIPQPVWKPDSSLVN